MADNLRKRVLVSDLPPSRSHHSNSSGASSNGHMRKKDYTPIPWNQYFDRKHDVKVDDDICVQTFCVYESGTEGPVCFFLHGGGFSGLSWALLSKKVTEMLPCRCAAMDSRGHGSTRTSDDSLLSADVQARDVSRVIEKLYGEEGPSILLVGHSMGGAIAIHSVVADMIPTVAGLIVIDVVEGTALEALASMQSFLRGRPTKFKSLEHAIEYCVRTGQIRNLESARVSVSGQIKRLDDNSPCDSNGVKSSNGHSNSHSNGHSNGHTGTLSGKTGAKGTIKEESEENEEDDDDVDHSVSSANDKAESNSSNDQHSKGAQASDNHLNDSGEDCYGWRIDLTKTEKYWQGWFQGMSKMFLSCSVPKMLLLAGIDRLDKELTVGQMQGKFQMQVLPKCGHAVHEDSPDKVAEVVASFLVRNRMVEPTENYNRAFLVLITKPPGMGLLIKS